MLPAITLFPGRIYRYEGPTTIALYRSERSYDRGFGPIAQIQWWEEDGWAYLITFADPISDAIVLTPESN